MVVNLDKLRYILLIRLLYIQMHMMLKVYHWERILLLHHLYILMGKLMVLKLNLEHRIHFHYYGILNCK